MARKVKPHVTPQQRRRRIIRWLVGIIGGLVALAIIIAIVLYLRATGEPPMPRDALAGMEQGAAATSASWQVARVQEAIRQGRRQPVNLQLTNADISQLIRLGGVASSQLSDPQVYFGSGRAIARGKLRQQGRIWNTQVAIKLGASNGRLNATIDELWIGKMKAPDSLKRRLQEQLSRELERQATPARLGVYVETITMEPGRATVTGHTLGR